MDRQTATIRTFGTRDLRRLKRVVNIVVRLTRRHGAHWPQSAVRRTLARRNQQYIRSRRVTT